jgi:hypothetical protein
MVIKTQIKRKGGVLGAILNASDGKMLQNINNANIAFFPKEDECKLSVFTSLI